MPLDLSRYDGIAIKVRSRERLKYTFVMHHGNGLKECIWQAGFEVPAAGSGGGALGWARIEIPFSEFRSQKNGRILDKASRS